jgi:hypothetical protein
MREFCLAIRDYFDLYKYRLIRGQESRSRSEDYPQRALVYVENSISLAATNTIVIPDKIDRLKASIVIRTAAVLVFIILRS